MKFKEQGKWLVKLREEKGMSQAKLARKMGLESPQFISNIERGVAAIPACQIRKVAKILKKDAPLLEILVGAHMLDYEAAYRAELMEY